MPLSILGLSNMTTDKNSGVVNCIITPTYKENVKISFEAIVVDTICSDQPNFTVSRSWPHIEHLNLADKDFYKSAPIDGLLGAHIFSQILQSGIIKGQSIHEPTAINTHFGWILLGSVNSQHNYNLTSLCIPSLSEDLNLFDLRTFWELEEIPDYKCMSSEDKLCEKIYSENYYRDLNGRYTVPLPFKNSYDPVFEGSYEITLRRFYYLERRLNANPELGKMYYDFMADYITSGHMERVKENFCATDLYYIPHHCVFKPDSPSTKVRVVFDSSCKDLNGLSLNDTLLVGQKLQSDICSILLNFRLHIVVFTADIRQMYRQILITPSQRQFQRIIFRFSSNEPLTEYQLNTVTYGVNAAPFLALRTLRQLAKDEEVNYPLASKVLSSNMYIDDAICGESSLDAAHILKTQLIALLAKGGFELRKWASNNPDLLSDLPSDHLYHDSLSLDLKDENIKILGLQWNPASDVFSYKVATFDRPCTKRNILSEIARIYDPLGFLAPLIFMAKILIQALWSLGLSWDDKPPTEIINRWEAYKQALPLLSKIQIPRFVFHESHRESAVELHGFCDASERGYCGVVYLRIPANGSFNIYLLSAKTKVAPLKRLTIPRLELCAPALLAKLMHFILNTYKDQIQFSMIYAWSDSLVALAWIKSLAFKWHTFVNNRVSFIQERISPDCWHHVSSSDNPADGGSRGMLPTELIDCVKWWVGPNWLSLPQCLWPTPICHNLVTHEEEKLIAFASVVNLESIDLILSKYSSLSKVKRILAYALRFIQNIKNKNKLKGPLNTNELEAALRLIIQRTQAGHFSEDISLIQRNRLATHSLRELAPFVDSEGFLRVGGRLQNSELSYDVKHPILLPRNSRFTELLILHTHNQYFHPGNQQLQFIISQRFWILSARRAIRHVISKCLKCWRLRPKSFQPPMGNLPLSRIAEIKAFSISGVDFCGPITITLSKIRGAKTCKAWICIFVCFATKALHVELASDMSTDCFIAVLRRFIARRGRCSTLFSDCGTNFVGANRYLLNLMEESANKEHITWKFNPPASPHFNGLAESSVKSVKTHLLRVIGKQILTFEELSTVLTQVEAVLNSRPLCELSNDPNDLSALTPGHFLTLEPMSAIPEPTFQNLNLNRLNRWQLLQRLHSDFWSRYKTEYLHTLHQKAKWHKAENVSVGTLCIIKNEETPPLNWQLARIVKLHPGNDGVVRVATKSTVNGHVTSNDIKTEKSPSEELKKSPEHHKKEKKIETHPKELKKAEIAKKSSEPQELKRKSSKKSNLNTPVDFDEGDWETVPSKADKKKKGEQAPTKKEKKIKIQVEVQASEKEVTSNKEEEQFVDEPKFVLNPEAEPVEEEVAKVIKESVPIIEENKEKRRKEFKTSESLQLEEAEEIAAHAEPATPKLVADPINKFKDAPVAATESVSTKVAFDELGDTWTDAKPVKKSKKKARRDN